MGCRFFFYYVTWQLLLSIYVCLFASLHLGLLSREKGSLAHALQDTPATVVVIVVSFAAICAVQLLFRYHVSLMARNVTTNEDFKAGSNVFDQGWRANIASVLCGPRPPSRMHAREWLHDGVHPSNRTLTHAPTPAPPLHRDAPQPAAVQDVVVEVSI